MNRRQILTGTAALVCAVLCVFAPQARAQTTDISGTWTAKMTSPMGEMEITYKLTVTDGKITGTATMPWGDSPIVDGAVEGDQVHFTVQMQSPDGNTMKAEAKGKIVGDTLLLTPAMPGPPDGGGPGGPPQGGPGGMKPLVFHRRAS